jgi:hypothetical protein
MQFPIVSYAFGTNSSGSYVYSIWKNTEGLGFSDVLIRN